MTEYPRAPEGWNVVGERSVGPFRTSVTYVRPDGRRIEWTSRAHRKHASRLSRGRPEHHGVLWAPRRASWWIAVLFVGGSSCFLVAPLPVFLELVGAETDATVFFVGSVLFTAAATLQWLETVNTDRGPGARPEGRVRLLAWEPRRIDWWSCGIQLAGTVFFNISTFRALTTAVDASSYDKLVWQPDAFGSICFLLSGYLAYVEVTHGLLHRPPRSLEGWIVAVNLSGCVAFGLSALAAYVIPATGSIVNATVANAATSLGALAFLVGALLLLPEAARVTAPAPAQDG